MRLLKYKVTDFRSVIDSGWVDVEQVTALIGVNESGKTNLLLPLWKLNPAVDGELRPNSDYPKTKFGMIRENPGKYTFITAIFDTDAHATKLAELSGAPVDAVRTVTVTRKYDGFYTIGFPDHSPKRNADSTEVQQLLSTAIQDFKGLSPLAKEGSLSDARRPEKVELEDRSTGLQWFLSFYLTRPCIRARRRGLSSSAQAGRCG